MKKVTVLYRFRDALTPTVVHEKGEILELEDKRSESLVERGVVAVLPEEKPKAEVVTEVATAEVVDETHKTGLTPRRRSSKPATLKLEEE